MYLKWAGGKRNLADKILSIADRAEFNSLTEPFAGAAAVSCQYRAKGGTRPVRLYDSNPDLINLHASVAYGREFFLSFAEVAWDTFKRKDYSAVRDMFNSRKLSEYTQAAMFLWMNKYGFNGLCRYNSSGKYNVPVGKQKSDPKLPKDEMISFWRSFRRDEIAAVDFGVSMTLANSVRGDLFYCDPPYIGSGSFVDYTGSGFSMDQQVELAERARMLADNGRYVIVSNSLCDESLAVYGNADRIETVVAARSISCNGDGRKPVEEMIAIYGIN